MKTLCKIALVAIMVMPSAYCLAAEPDCDGTTSANCHPPTTSGPTYYFCGKGGCFDNCTKSSSAGDNSINVCTRAKDNSGTCASAGTIACHFTTTFTSPSGVVVFSGPDSSNPDTYACK